MDCVWRYHPVQRNSCRSGVQRADSGIQNSGLAVWPQSNSQTGLDVLIKWMMWKAPDFVGSLFSMATRKKWLKRTRKLGVEKHIKHNLLWWIFNSQKTLEKMKFIGWLWGTCMILYKSWPVSALIWRLTAAIVLKNVIVLIEQKNQKSSWQIQKGLIRYTSCREQVTTNFDNWILKNLERFNENNSLEKSSNEHLWIFKEP